VETFGDRGPSPLAAPLRPPRAFEEFSAEHPAGRLLGRREEGYYSGKIRRHCEKFDLVAVLTMLHGPPRGDGE
jgi:hypothetical protein